MMVRRGKIQVTFKRTGKGKESTGKETHRSRDTKIPVSTWYQTAKTSVEGAKILTNPPTKFGHHDHHEICQIKEG